MFDKELDFEKAVIEALQHNGWSDQVIYNPTEQDLIDNWAKILFENNREQDRLNGDPLVKEEMDQLLEQINKLKTPLALNGFINAGSVSIERRNPADTLHYGKQVSLKIYDRLEIAGGKSRYQIVEQPVFNRRNKILQDRRGDLMLLINGMPVFHMELKRTGVPVYEASNQIEKYAHEGIFTGLFSLIQIFVAMTPEDTLYFANPGPEGKFRKEFFFHWADINNAPIKEWSMIVSTFLKIPTAHQMIGFYTVADDSDGVLKVMRSYQYYAVNKIADRVIKRNNEKWIGEDQRGGYIWHTTGSGKTMTSFKAAQLIASSHTADKVVFLMDRVELGTQSLKEYRGFADDPQDVQDTDSTNVLISKLKSTRSMDTLIVSSIQKMSNIKADESSELKARDLEMMQNKRIVFIIDECHRSTFGDMLYTIKQAFPKAIFFGFTGTPVFGENEKKHSTTAQIFGDELHRYSIADGIRDGNVLGFDPTMVMVYEDGKIRKAIALEKCGAKTPEEALSDPKKRKKFDEYMYDVPMAGERNGLSYVKGIEDYINGDLYHKNEYRSIVVEDIENHWTILSRNGKFHALFATSSIPEAILYYKLMKDKFNVTAIFDPNIDNEGGKKSLEKEDGLVELLSDYNTKFHMNFDISPNSYDKFKKDVAARLAHKRPYTNIKEGQQLDIVIVVNQLLTGFDSKWVNTLYLDKVVVYQDLIQAFSRTNRLFDMHEKPFGNIRYYRKPHTMKRNIEEAVKLFSGDRPFGLFADHLHDNIRHMNTVYEDIQKLFEESGVSDMASLPEETAEVAKFASLFNKFNEYLQAAKIQGFHWDKMDYPSSEETEENKNYKTISVLPDEKAYNTLLQRYKEVGELKKKKQNNGFDGYCIDIDPYLTELSTGQINTEYMNSKFDKYLKQLHQENVSEEEKKATMSALYNSFAFLSKEEQVFANLFIHDVEAGDIQLDPGKTFRDYITEYAAHDKNKKLLQVHEYLGVDVDLLKNMVDSHVTEKNLDEYGRFTRLMNTVVQEKAAAYITGIEQKPLKKFEISSKVRRVLQRFILSGGKEFEIPGEENTSEEKK